MTNTIKVSFLNMAALATIILLGSWAHAQFPGMPQPKHYAWSDPKLSPDVRADLVVTEMTLAEKMLLLHGQGLSFFSFEPTESNGGAGFTKPISRLGIPAVQMADSAYGSDSLIYHRLTVLLRDSKSAEGNLVGVRPPLPAPH